jgi:hypothetical protein
MPNATCDLMPRIKRQQDVDQVSEWLDNAAQRAISRSIYYLGNYDNDSAKRWSLIARSIREVKDNYREADAACAE